MTKYTNEHIMNKLNEMHTTQEITKVELKNLTKDIKGNGQPGLVQKVESNEDKLDKHLIKDTEWKGKKDGSISSLKWVVGIGLSILAILITFFQFI